MIMQVAEKSTKAADFFCVYTPMSIASFDVKQQNDHFHPCQDLDCSFKTQS